MTSKKRKLPGWLCGVALKKNKEDHSTCNVTANKETRTKYPNTTLNGKDGSSVTLKKDKVQVNEMYGQASGDNDYSLDKILEMSLPEYKFKGSVIYSYQKDDCNILCEDILSSVEASAADVCMGFDTEWPVTYQTGGQARAALIQVCLSEDKCYLFQVSCMSQIPVALKRLLENPAVKKIGMNIEPDLWKLQRDYDLNALQVIKHSMVELRTLANKKLKSAENWSLEGLTKNVLRCRISKDPSIRKCDWSQYPLPEEQKIYAATDAIVSLKLYNKLTKM